MFNLIFFGFLRGRRVLMRIEYGFYVLLEIIIFYVYLIGEKVEF